MRRRLRYRAPVASATERFLEAAQVLGRRVEIRRFPEGTKTAEDAARAIGCDVAQIVKSLVLMADDRPILALTSGSNRADLERLAGLAGASTVRRATPEEARAATGFAVGGTPPFNVDPYRLPTFVDETLLPFDEVWAGAGAPDAVFAIAPSDLVRSSDGTVAGFAQGTP